MTRTQRSIVERPDERGSALLGVLLLLMMMSAMAAALGMNGRTETLISRNQRSGTQAQAAAEAGLNHAVELATTYISEWNANGLADAEAAMDALLLGPDLASGTVATDADNGSLGTRAGITVAEEIPLGARLTIAAGIDADYEAFVMDDDATAPDEPTNNLYDDENGTLIVRATSYAKNGLAESKVVLEALLTEVPLAAVVAGCDLDISGNVDVYGTGGSVHANCDLDISGGAASVAGTATASGTYTGSPPGGGGAAELPVPEISASDYLTSADFILTSTGTMTDQGGTVLACCNNWSFDGGSGEWSFSGTPPDGTYYVEGSVSISGNHGSNGNPMEITIIAEGSIDISGNQDIEPDTADLQFVTDGDLQITGNFETHAQGQMLVHEQIHISGNITLEGQIIVEDAASVSTLVTTNSISGNVDITYNGSLSSGVFIVSGWRDVRDND